MGINMTVSLIVDDCSLLFAVAIELVIRWRYLKNPVDSLEPPATPMTASVWSLDTPACLL
jgi:hypothetical protein